MKKHPQKLATIFLLVVLVSACSLPGAPVATQIPVEAIYTAAAQTLQAQLTQSAAQQPPTQAPPPVPTDTLAPVEMIPTDTPTPAFTATLLFTPTPLVPIAVVDVNSNCRKGPSPDYDPPISVLRKGDRAEIFGRNNDRSWWYVQIPGKPGQFCWVWGNNVTVEGDTSGVQFVQPPPLPPTITYTPTQDAEFDPSFDNVHNCGGDPFAIFELDNTGGVAFESMRLVIVDLDDDDEIFDASSDAPFMGAGGECPPGGDRFPVGKTFWVGGNIEDGGSGHDAEATITLCTKEDLDGTCVSEDVEFEIP
jgi:hypothetical protein